jgi:ATP-dependent DNA ligase
MDFPILYGEASTGKVKMWKIAVSEGDCGAGVIITLHGYEDGKQQTNIKTVDEGKNKGKSNATTALQQAVNEARALFQKKRDAGYSERGASAVAGGRAAATAVAGGRAAASAVAGGRAATTAVAGGRAATTDETVPAPMLAHDFNKRGTSIKFPCYIQRKYDGTRCVAIPSKGLFSRNRKSYPHLEHILNELEGLPPSLILDGELYSETLTFQEIVGLVKKQTLTDEDRKKQGLIELHVYDLIIDAPYSDRYARLQALFAVRKFSAIRLVETQICENKELLKLAHDRYVGEGYEGIMLRNADGKYKVGQRSADLQKYKEFQDDEYEVVGFTEGDGLEKGCIIWQCRTSDGKIFACRPRGSREERSALFAQGNEWIGKKLTVRFQELTTDGVPRFPVGITFRDYE